MNTLLALVVGIVLGIVMCIPIGPLNVIAINMTANNKRNKALGVSFGGSMMDFFYFAILVNGFTVFSFSDTTAGIFKVLGILLVFLMGLYEIIGYYRFKKTIVDNATASAQEIIKKEEKVLENKFLKKWKYYLVKHEVIFGVVFGAAIYISNPTLIATMTGLSAFVKSAELFVVNHLSATVFALGAGIGSFTWFYFLTLLVEKNRSRFSDNIIRKLNLVCGLLLIVLTIIMVLHMAAT